MTQNDKDFKPLGHYKTLESLQERLVELGVALKPDHSILDQSTSPLAKPFSVTNAAGHKFTIGNRWCIHPMEGWDADPDGKPSELTIRRWERFGISGAKLIWGGEAYAVQHNGRANPRQLYYRTEHEAQMLDLRKHLVKAHTDRFGSDSEEDLFVGLQLTHSGRFSRPNQSSRAEPRILYRHPVLDQRVGATDQSMLSDDEIKQMIENFISSARLAERVGFQFVDVKHCHGYLGHEFLSAYDRPGPYGGDFEGRTRFMREIVTGIQAACPSLHIGVRLSLFDQPPFQKPEAGGIGVCAETEPNYPGFGLNRDNPLEQDLTEPIRLLRMMRDELKISLVNISVGSPYYNPHIQRPASYPPSDGYLPPEDPLIGCFRQMNAVYEMKRALLEDQTERELPLVGSGYTYFQDYLPQIAQAAVRESWVDSVGIGRLALSYPDLPADTLETGELKQPKLICRTFSDCTTAPRNGMISGCYPLDPYYKKLPERKTLLTIKKKIPK